MGIRDQYSITLGFNRTQYKELVQLALDGGHDTIYSFLKSSIVKTNKLTASRQNSKNSMSLKDQLKLLKKEAGD